MARGEKKVGAAKKYNVVIFGATGFTGQFVVEELAKRLKDRQDGQPFSWAVAGRSVDKLAQILKQASDATGININAVDKIEADISSQESLLDMAKQATVVLNCVGPYRFFGEQVVKACIEGGAHHLDISGERLFLEKMQLLYNNDAEKNGVYVIGACGFDSIPADCGVTFLQQQFDGDLNSVESYIEMNNDSKKRDKSAAIHYGTWQSAIHAVANSRDLGPLRKELFPTRLPKPSHDLAKRFPLHKSKVAGGWSLPFGGPDQSVVERSQRYFYEVEQKRPVQIKTYIRQPNLIAAIVVMIIAIIFGILAQFRWGRYLLEKYPGIFSLGYVSHEGPSREAADATKFTFTLSGEGWKEKLTNPNENHTTPPNKKMVVQVRGKNPGYGDTCTCMVQAALTLLDEPDKLPPKGGVYTPGAVFAKTSLVDRLNNSGMSFAVVSQS